MIRVRIFTVVLILILLSSIIPYDISARSTISSPMTGSDASNSILMSDNYDDFSQGDFSAVNLSSLTLHLSLDESSATINGTLLIDFFNNVPTPIDRIPFHLYTSGMQYNERQGEIIVNNVTAIGSSPAVDTYEVISDAQLMWVNLESDVQPEEFVSLNITFQTLMPDGQDRSGYYGTDIDETRIYTFADSYPIPCVYDEFDGWNIDPYLPVGDPFYFEMAFYDLYVQIPENMTIAGTGEIAAILTEGGHSTYHYNISYPVREVTFSASRYYQSESEIYNGVNVSAYFLPATANLWETDTIEMGIQALNLFNTSFGIYPYSTLNIVEQHAFYAGMEYPCQVYITYAIGQQILEGTRAVEWFELAIAHEVAHQWWSQIVGDDCVDWGFLDENLASWSHAYYGEVYYDDWTHFQDTRFLDIVRTFYAEYSTGSIINLSNTVRPDLTSYVDYTQGPVILEKLRLTLGNSQFMLALKDFFQSQYFQIATLNDLQASFEVVHGTSLDWFFMPWYGNGYLPEYAIESAVYNPSTGNLTFDIVDLNEYRNDYSYSQQIPLVIKDSQGNDLIDSIVWVNGTTSFEFPLTTAPYSITLDYSDFVLVQLPDTLTTSYSISSGFIQTVSPFGPDVIFIGVVFLSSGILFGIMVLVEKRRPS
ncbi:MAG: M1 family metallopeptidase [Candidatus Thorarchaeota archaeon]